MANRIISGLGWTTASSVSRNVVSLLQIAVLTRFLDKADFGIVAIAYLFISFTSLFLDMGISVGIIHRQRITNNEYSSLFWLNVLMGIVLTLGLFILAPFITSSYNSEELTNVVQLICFTIFLSALGTQQITFCQKNAYFKRLAIIEIISAIITMAVAITTAVLGYGVYSLAISSLSGSFFTSITHLVIGLITDSRLRFHFVISETYPFLKIGIYQIGASILDFFTRELDIMIVSTTLGLEFLGIYNIAKRIPTAIYSFIAPIVSRVFAPILAEKQGDINELKVNYMRLSKSLSWISFPMYLFLAAISPTIISVVFGGKYLDGVPVMMVFCLRYAFNGVNGVCGALQTATGRTDIGLKWTIYLIVSTFIVYYTTSHFGIIIFLYGVVSLTLVNALVCWYMQFKQMVGIRLVEYLTLYTHSFIICTVLSTIVYFVYSEPSVIYSFISGIIYILFFAFFIVKSRDGKEILDTMKAIHVPDKIILITERIR